MSGLIKQTKNESQIATKTTRGNAKKNLKTERIDAADVNLQSDANLNDVAIALADAETAKAIKTYNARKAEGLGKFAAHVQATQHQTSTQMLNQIYDFFGMDEDDIYEADQASDI